MSTYTTKPEIVHFLLTRQDMRARNKSMADFGEHTICGNGQPPNRLKTTRSHRFVTCQECLNQLRSR